jgi:protein transport protein SEC61 subunit gamma and related proteins
MDIKNTIERMRRVLLVASKPDKSEFMQSAKITGLGFAIIGGIGFVIFIIVQLITAGAGL